MAIEPVSKRFSINRLNGEPIPDDLRTLLAHSEELSELTGIELNVEDEWAPWLDISYLSETDRAIPEIMANVRAIAEVCRFIAFVAATEDGEYFGYWRGPAMEPIARAPVIVLDTEGQFLVCAPSFAGLVMIRTYGENQLAETRDWLLSLGIDAGSASLDQIVDAPINPSPAALHAELYRRYIGASSDA